MASCVKAKGQRVAVNLSEMPVVAGDCGHQFLEVKHTQHVPYADGRRIEYWLIGYTCELSAAGIDTAELWRSSHEIASSLRVAGARMLDDWLEQLIW